MCAAWAGGCRMGWLLVLGAAMLLGAESKVPLETPTFGDIYHVTGVISLPYAEIREPFEAWYNLTRGKSRIQYYGGQVVTYQLGSIEPFGASFKVTPETTETEVNVRKCFRINGTDGDLITPQSVFPSLENFKRVRDERCQGQPCAVWQNISYWGHKKNVYRLWVGSSAHGPVPLHYEVRGYNSLLGSHYDKYEIDYSSFSHCFSPSVFQLPEGVQCKQWPAAGPEHRIVANPMQEFVGHPQEMDHIHHRLFHRYKEHFSKSYSSEEEHEHRKRAFIHNMRRCDPREGPGRLRVLLELCHHGCDGGCPIPQVLIDCSWGFGNYACDGGEEWRAYEWIKKHGGIASTESYGPYLGQNGYCHCNQSELVAQLAGYVTVEPGSATALKAALVKHGPVAVNIDASHKSFAFYANGVYEEPHCGNETMALDHAVLAVGYGVLHGKSYWLIKNSWSTYWGNDGYVLMAMKDNNCGVATAASFPILA
ncbi:uncharacterized protein LOC136023246 isoform X2 [Lathamus discolor]|uniref:uncharacterized protein LOC136023246 isoform X2 n=1 Tax=Lathamus discolor TaxID=678569 RepID=UPI0032B83406